MRKRQRQIHVAAAAKTDFGFLGDDSFAQSGQRNRQLDGGARLVAARERKFLIDHGENASAGRLNRQHRAIHVAQCVNRGLADDRVFAGGDIAVRDVA